MFHLGSIEGIPVPSRPEQLNVRHRARQTANYVAMLLRRAGVVDLITDRPARVRLSSAWSLVA